MITILTGFFPSSESESIDGVRLSILNRRPAERRARTYSGKYVPKEMRDIEATFRASITLKIEMKL